MAVWFNLNIGEQRIGGVEIRRRTHLDLSNPAAIADVWSIYDVRYDGEYVGDVWHRYGDGAWELLALVSPLIAEYTGTQEPGVGGLAVGEWIQADCGCLWREPRPARTRPDPDASRVCTHHPPPDRPVPQRPGGEQ